MKEALAKLGFEPAGSTRREFGETITRELVKWRKVVRDSGAKVQ